MSKFESTFKAAIAENERRILIDSLRASPELTIGEIHRLSKGGLGRLFNEITISDLIGGASNNSNNSSSAGRSFGDSKRNAKRAATETGSAGMSGMSGLSGLSGLSGHGNAGAAAEAGPRRGRPRADALVADASAGADSKGGKGRRIGGKAKNVNTRTSEGRSEYDEALFQAVHESGGPAGAGSIIARAGGSSLQARAGLARLIEAGRITWSGKARGTKYSVV